MNELFPLGENGIRMPGPISWITDFSLQLSLFHLVRTQRGPISQFTVGERSRSALS